MKKYIRVGEIPKDEKSSIHRGDAIIGKENGVSVYNCVKINDKYHIVMPLPLKEGQGMTYESLIQEITQCRYEIENPRKVYLVSGIEVGKGHDNEPLIKDVKILKDLTRQFNTKNEKTKEIKTLKKLVEPNFKDGDKIKHKCDKNNTVITITGSKHDYYYIQYYDNKKNDFQNAKLSFTDQDKYELIIDKFDINTLKPF